MVMSATSGFEPLAACDTATGAKVLPGPGSGRCADLVQVQPHVTLAALVPTGDDVSDVAQKPADRQVVGVVGRGELVDAVLASDLGQPGEQCGAQPVVLPVLGNLDGH